MKAPVTDISTDVDQVMETSLLRGKVTLIQPKKGFHASVDTVLLAAAVPARARHKVLDVGCGVGSAGLCVFSRVKGVSLTGLEVQPDIADLARLNMTLNNLGTKGQVITGDLRTCKDLPQDAFDQVLMNPPYAEGGVHIPSPDKKRHVSLDESGSGAALSDWIKYGHRRLKTGGTLTLIHRADRLDDILSELSKNNWFGDIVVYPLWPKKGIAAKRAIVSARKGRKGGLTMAAGMVLHKENGDYTAEAQRVLSKGMEIKLKQ